MDQYCRARSCDRSCQGLKLAQSRDSAVRHGVGVGHVAGAVNEVGTISWGGVSHRSQDGVLKTGGA